MKRFSLAVLAFALFLPTTAQAGLVSGFGGNTQPEIVTSVGTTDGFINFAVFDTSGGTAGDHYGTGLAGIDSTLASAGFSTTSKYLYLFQDVNIGNDIASSSVNLIGKAVTGDGFLGGIAYSQVTSGHPFLGGSAATAGNISEAVTNATQANARAATQAGLISPTLLSLNTNSLVVTFSPAMAGLDARSVLWGYTSDMAPAYVLGSIQDSGVAANGTVPGNVAAEPSSVVLGIFGLIGLLGLAGIRRRPKFLSLAAVAALCLIPASANAQDDPANIHVNGPGGFAQSGGGTDWVTLPGFANNFTLQDVANNGEIVSPWHLVIAIPNVTGTLLDDITKIGSTSVNIANDGETTLLAGQDAYIRLGVPGNGLPNSMSFTNFAAADLAVAGIPTPANYGLYDFTISPANLAILAGALPETVQLGGTGSSILPTGSIIFAWGVDQNGTTISTAFTNAGVVNQQAISTPEPSTLLIALIGTIGFVTFARARYRK